jgi:small subunit ribosomal protein S2
MPSNISLRRLLEMGVHFGHRTQKWNPKMAPFIFTERNGIHILDLQQTVKNLNTYYDLVRDLIANGGSVMFVGTKRQAQETIAREAGRCGMPYVNQRWLGGTLTNWRTIRERIDTLKKLEGRRDSGELDLLTKKEALRTNRQIAKLQIRLGGIRDMKSVPDVIIVVDTRREHTAIKEANILKIPVLALLDSNCNPDLIDYIIPGNDDAMRSIKLIMGAFANAVLEGKAMRKGDDGEMLDAIEQIDVATYSQSDDEDAGDEAYLGESTLAKLRDANLFEEENADAAKEAEEVVVEEAEAKVEEEPAVTDENEAEAKVEEEPTVTDENEEEVKVEEEPAATDENEEESNNG